MEKQNPDTTQGTNDKNQSTLGQKWVKICADGSSYGSHHRSTFHRCLINSSSKKRAIGRKAVSGKLPELM